MFFTCGFICLARAVLILLRLSSFSKLFSTSSWDRELDAITCLWNKIYYFVSETAFYDIAENICKIYFFRWGTHLNMSLFCPSVHIWNFLCKQRRLREFRSKIVFTKPLPRQIYYCVLFCLFVSWPVSPNMDLNKRQCNLGHPDRWDSPT